MPTWIQILGRERNHFHSHLFHSAFPNARCRQLEYSRHLSTALVTSQPPSYFDPEVKKIIFVAYTAKEFGYLDNVQCFTSFLHLQQPL